VGKPESTPTAADFKALGQDGKKGQLCPDREVVLFQHKGADCLTHMWFGGDWPRYDRTRIRFYVDGETEPWIDMELFLGHGIGWSDSSAPWGSGRMGKTGHPSGLYSTYRILSGKSIRVTGQLGAGVEKLPVFLGNVRLPENAQLRLQVRDNVRLEPLQLFDSCHSSHAGALYQVTLSVASENFNFLEPVLKACVDGAKEPLFLSSGTKEYFLGTYYFKRGMYHFPVAGLTHKAEDATGTCRFSAHRFHEGDPIIFQKGFRPVWRTGEDSALVEA
jgi:hypothetical protein